MGFTVGVGVAAGFAVGFGVGFGVDVDFVVGLGVAVSSGICAFAWAVNIGVTISDGDGATTAAGAVYGG